MSHREQNEQYEEEQDDFSFKKLFVPLTTFKAIHWIIFIGLIVYANMLFNGFVWDDTDNIVYNTTAHSITNIVQFFAGSTFNSGGQGGLVGLYYKPLITTAFAFIYTIFGGSPFSYHLFQLMIHIGNAILIFLFLKIFFHKPLAFFLSLIFLVHPINVEAVSYISAIEDPLFFFFGMMALLLAAYTSLKNKTYYLVSLCLLLAVLSKESGFIFILVILVYVLLYKKKEFYKYLLAATPVILIYSILRFGLAKIYFSAQPVFPMMRLTLEERIKNLPEMLFFYIKNVLYPKDLAIAQDWTLGQITIQNFYLPLGIVLCFFLGLVLFGFYLQKKHNKSVNLFLFFSILLIISLGIHLQFVPLDLTVAERWFYLPLFGVLGLFGLLLQRIKLEKQFIQRVLVSGAVVVVVLLSFRSIIRNGDWKDEATLYRHDIQVNKQSYALESNYGLILLREGKIHEGRAHLLKSTQMAPYRWANWTNLGASYEIEEDYVNARKYYLVALSKGRYYGAYEHYAHFLIFNDTPQQAEKFCKRAVKIFPFNGTLWLYLAVSEYKLGNKQAALNAAQIAYKLSPNKDTQYVYSNLLQNLPIELK